MSERFVNLVVPCNECLVRPICKDKKETERRTNLYNGLLGIPKVDETKKMYHKSLIECWANMGVDIIEHMSHFQTEGMPKEAQAVFMNYLIEVSNTLRWLVNSESWKDGKENSYDSMSLRHKTRQSIGWLPK